MKTKNLSIVRIIKYANFTCGFMFFAQLLAEKDRADDILYLCNCYEAEKQHLSRSQYFQTSLAYGFELQAHWSLLKRKVSAVLWLIDV